jgi:hypothetical protein
MTGQHTKVLPGHWLETNVRAWLLASQYLLRNDNVRKISTQPFALGSRPRSGPASRDNVLGHQPEILHKNQVALGRLCGGFRPGIE